MLGKTCYHDSFTRRTPVGDPDPRTLMSTTYVSGNACAGFFCTACCAHCCLQC